MSDDWTTFNVKYYAIPITALVFGIVIGFGLELCEHWVYRHFFGSEEFNTEIIDINIRISI